jgi:hypothetical protein
MSVSFDPNHGPILLTAQISGPLGAASLVLLLDTGATSSLTCRLNQALMAYSDWTSSGAPG